MHFSWESVYASEDSCKVDQPLFKTMCTFLIGGSGALEQKAQKESFSISLHYILCRRAFFPLFTFWRIHAHTKIFAGALGARSRWKTRSNNFSVKENCCERTSSLSLSLSAGLWKERTRPPRGESFLFFAFKAPLRRRPSPSLSAYIWLLWYARPLIYRRSLSLKSSRT